MLLYYYTTKNSTWDGMKEKIHQWAVDVDNLRILNILEQIESNMMIEENIRIHSYMDSHAFILTLYCLRQNMPFMDAIKYVLSLGGDTDTNVAIVG